jgi:hypothetical protein
LCLCFENIIILYKLYNKLNNFQYSNVQCANSKEDIYFLFQEHLIMNYCFKKSKIFYYLLVSFLFSFITVSDLLHLGFLKSHFIIVCEVIFILLFWYVTWRLLYLILFKKPALSINEDYIFDRLDNVKYQWGDIDEVIESHTLLRIKLQDPKKYLNRIGDPVQRCIAILTFWLYNKKSPYVINLNLLDANTKELIKTLNHYMTQSTGREK